MWSGAVGNEQGRCLGSGLESFGEQTSPITLREGEMRGWGQEGLVLPLAWGAVDRVLASASPVTCHPGLCSLCLSGACGRSCKNMVQKYQSPVRIYKYPFELVMAVSDPWFSGPK